MHHKLITEGPPALGLRPTTAALATPEPYRLTRSEFPAGQIVAGKYRVERWIGEGAMGVVLAATHLGLDETVAIKLIRPDAQRSTDLLSRFAKEAKIAARIRSEHVPRVLDVGVSERFGPYIVMEYLEGRSLGELLEVEGKLQVRQAVEYVLQACEALAAAHSIGVIHRDIKPGNLFISRHGSLEVVKLLDFGISKAALTGRVFGNDLALNETGHVMGTPIYMSPEQIRSAPDIDSRTDIWSLGAVIYELVTGKTAFMGKGMTEICSQILEGPVPQLGVAHDPQEQVLQSVLNRCLARDREERFQTVADVAAALLPLASDSARLYADRSSCILRASGLGLERASNALAAEGLEALSARVSPMGSRTLRVAGLVGGALSILVLAVFSAIELGTPTSSVVTRPEISETPASVALERGARGAPRELPLTATELPPVASTTAAAGAPTPAPPQASPERPSRSRAPLPTKDSSEIVGPAGEAERMRLVRSPPRMRLVGLSETSQ